MVEQASLLLIEDEARLRRNLQIILQGEGYRVVAAENGLEGIQRAQAEPFDFELMQFVIQRALEKARMQKAFRHYMSELERRVEKRAPKLTQANQHVASSVADLPAATQQL